VSALDNFLDLAIRKASPTPILRDFAMAKRFIERPTARQIMTEAERQIMRDQRQISYDAKREAAASWLDANYAPTPEAPRKPRAEVDTMIRTVVENDKWITMMDNWNEMPDPMGKTGNHEPKSIHDPVPPSRISRIAPKKRKPRDPYATDQFCELPDYRRKQTYVIEDENGVARGAIEINPFSKKFRIGGFGL
jgi:hypothetical protein